MSLFAQPFLTADVHPSFDVVATDPRYSGARIMFDSLFAQATGLDKNFIREFQSQNGFDARVFELYMFAVLAEAGCEVVGREAPDFECRMDGTTFYVEVTTAAQHREEPPASPAEYFEQLERSEIDWDALAIRMGSPLYSKLQKRYHRMPHVVGHPFLIALQDFGDVGALYHSEISFLSYLLGNKLVDASGGLPAQLLDQEIQDHQVDGKTIPSGFFNQEGTEHISAILFSNAGTAGKFNRMAKIRGLGDVQSQMWRRGFEYDSSPEALLPIYFVEEVGVYEEPWHEGSLLIHNPAALHPLDPELLPTSSQITAHEDGLAFRPAARHVYGSQTITIATTDNDA